MSAKHTPGPWAWNGNDQLVSLATKSELGGPERIVETDSGYYPPFGADRALIAAAPELLEALQLFLGEYVALVNSGDAGSWDPEDEDKVKKARAAIAKATGSAQ